MMRALSREKRRRGVRSVFSWKMVMVNVEDVLEIQDADAFSRL